MTARELITRVMRESPNFQAARRTLRGYGIGIAYNGHDRLGGRAMARRQRQMDRGVIEAVCYVPGCNKPAPRGRDPRICDDCLAKKWGSR